MKYIIDLKTNTKFFYNLLLTVPTEYDVKTNMWSNPVLAPGYMDLIQGIVYLDPKRISKEDLDKLTEEYRQEQREY